jgi:hypothetical protein
MARRRGAANVGADPTPGAKVDRRKLSDAEHELRQRSSFGEGTYYYTDRKGRSWFSEPLEFSNRKGQTVTAQAMQKARQRATGGFR